MSFNEEKNTDCDTIVDGNKKSMLRFLTCGSVDDGKSTLIGNLLYNSKKLCNPDKFKQFQYFI